MPKIPLYQQQTQIGTAKGVTVDPSVAVNLAEAQSQNEAINVFQDYLGMGKSFVETYKKSKYNSDMAKSKIIESEFQNAVDSAWAEAQQNGKTGEEFKTDTFAEIKKTYQERYSKEGFFGDSLRDARESFNLLSTNEEGKVNAKVATKALQDEIDRTTETLRTAQSVGDLEAEKEAINALAILVGESRADQIASEAKQMTYVEQQQLNATRNQFSNDYELLKQQATKAVNEATTLPEKRRVLNEYTAKKQTFVEGYIETNPDDKNYYQKILTSMPSEINKEFFSSTGLITIESRKVEIDSLLKDNLKLERELTGKKREENLDQIEVNNKRLRELGYYTDTVQVDQANQSARQGASFTEAQISLTDIELSYDAFNTEWSKIEKQNEEGRFTDEQWASLRLIKRGRDNRNHKSVFVDPMQEITANPEKWNIIRINDLKGITDDQRNTLIAVYKGTTIENLYTQSPESAKHYAEITKVIGELQTAAMQGYYYNQYQKATTDEERQSIEKQANEQGYTVQAPDIEETENMTSAVERIAQLIYKQKDDKLLLPSNLISDLTSDLYRIAGDEKTYASQANPYGAYEAKLYNNFNKYILPRIQSMSNEAQINAITHARQMIQEELKRVGKERPRLIGSQNTFPIALSNPYTAGGYGLYATNLITNEGEARRLGGEALAERVKNYNEQEQEWKQSDHGVQEFLFLTLYPMYGQNALEMLMFEKRQSLINISQSADEVYGQ